jgi:2-phosphosulfolactate phosphatase
MTIRNRSSFGNRSSIFHLRPSLPAIRGLTPPGSPRRSLAVARAGDPTYHRRMKRAIRVHLLPALFEPGELAGGTAVVIDVLRATTTIVYALAAGAQSVIPCGEIDAARAVASSLPAGTALLGGERVGLKIAGFDLGNSPTEYVPTVVGGRTIVFTTTNGTRALLRSRQARRVVAGAFANLNAVVNWLAAETGPVHIICAGTDGQITLEDVLCAGTIARGLIQAISEVDVTDDSAALAIHLSETRGSHYDSLLAVLRAGRGGRNLIEHGLDADMITAARWDVTSIVPEWLADGALVPARGALPNPHRFIEPPG